MAFWDRFKFPVKDVRTVGSWAFDILKPPVEDVAKIGKALPRVKTPFEAAKKISYEVPKRTGEFFFNKLRRPVETRYKKTTDYFKPTKKVRVRDVARELPETGIKMLKLGTTIREEMSRSGGSLGLSLHNIFADIKDPSGRSRITEFKPREDAPKIERAIHQFVFGKEPVKAIEQRIKEGEKKAIELGVKKKYALPVSAIGVGAIIGLDFTGFGAGTKGIKNATRFIARADDVADISKVLRQVGVAEDLILPTAKKMKTIKSEVQILKALDKIEALQKSTKISPIRPSTKALETMRRPLPEGRTIKMIEKEIIEAKKALKLLDPKRDMTQIKQAKDFLRTREVELLKVKPSLPKAKPIPKADPLITEARKFIKEGKSAEEFVKSQNIVLAHNTTPMAKQDILFGRAYDMTGGFDLSKMGQTSKKYGLKYKQDPTGISFVYANKPIKGATWGGEKGTDTIYSVLKSEKPLEVEQFVDGIHWKEYLLKKYNVQTGAKLTRKLEAKGYDSIKTYNVIAGKKTYSEVVAFHPAKIQSFKTFEEAQDVAKSQLTDIYNKAKAPVKAKIKPVAKIKAEEGVIAPAKRLDEVLAGQKKIVPAKTPSKKVLTTEELPKISKPSPPSRKVIVSSDLVKKIKKSGDINKKLSSAPLYKKAYSKVVSKITDSKSFNKLKDSVSNAWINTREMVEDDWVRVKKLVQGDDVKVSEMSDPYSAEILMHGRIGTRVEEGKDIIKSIDKDILKLSKQTKKKSDIISDNADNYLIARHAPERNAILGDGAAGITTKKAKAVVKEIESLPESKELIKIADRMQELNNKTLDVLLEGEVIDRKLYDFLRNRYKFHIPLNRVMEDTEDIGSVIAGRPYDVRTTGILRAKGSEREVSDVMTNITNNYEQAIIRAEKNKVDLATLQFARDNKHLGLFNEIKPKAIGKTFDDKFILEKIDDPTVLVLREKGKPVFLKIEDPHLAVALRGVNRWKVDGVMKISQAITRFYSQLATRFNPEFFFPNKIRDLQEAVVYMASKKEFGFKGAAKASLRDPKSINSVMDYIRGVDSKGAKLYNQMRMDGGTTGGLGLSTRKKIELDIESIRKINRSKPRKVAEKVVEAVDNLNQVFEDSTRLSIYKGALKSGVSRKRAAVLAKEGTINFNKFGKGGPVINAMYMFSNASIQGSAKILRAMRNPKIAGTVVTAVGTAVVITNEWNDKVDPDWRNKVSKWDRMNSLPVIIPTKDGGITYVSIPVSWGIKPIKVACDYASDIMAGKENVKDAMSGVLASVMEGYNPVGGTDILSGAMPTIFDMPVELARNQGWHGGKIRPDWDKNAPSSIQYFPSLKDSITGRTMIGFSKGLSGIGIEMSPADMKYGYETLVGGAGRFISKVVNTTSAVGKQEVPELRDIPFVSRFLRERKVEQVGAGSKKYESVKKTLQEQSRERFILKQNAEDSYNQMKNIPKEDAKKMFDKIIKEDPALAKKVNEIIKEEKLGLNYIDRLVKQLGVSNGERAKFIVGELNKLKTKEEKRKYYQEMIDKKIISEEVGKQIIELLN